MNTQKKLYVPEPTPVKSEYSIGAYYFPGWKEGVHSGWPKIMPFPERKPLLGWYREGEPEVADWHIKWAVEHGIEFFAYDWYWCQGKRQLEHALHDGYFNAKYKDKLKFCLLWANHNPDNTSSIEDFENVTRYWIDNYFKLPQYYKIDGKPVVIIFSVGRFTKDMGVEKVKEGFEKMRDICKKNGIPGLYLAGCCGIDKQSLLEMKQEGYDSGTGYNYPWFGMTEEEKAKKSAPYDSMVESYKKIWDEIAAHKIIDYFPVVDPGWDSRPWHGKDALVRTDQHPDKFRKMLEYAKEYVNKYPVGKEKKKVVIVEAWNEFGEGDFVEPHVKYGFGYLDAIREVFTDPKKKHKDIVPEDVGLGPYNWPGL